MSPYLTILISVAGKCTNSHGNTNNEVYSQSNITALVAYGFDRGIRIIPEFDMPGHSGGFCSSLSDEGLVCCGSQIEDDPAGKSAAIISQVCLVCYRVHLNLFAMPRAL